MSQAKYIIIYDTYCGWCYGAAPIFDALVESGADVEVLHRHLFQGRLAYVMSEGKGDQVIQADARIAELTGQTFSQTYIDNVVLSKTEVLKSAYTAQAAALVHGQGAELEFAVRHRIETARFVEGKSAANRDAIVAALIAEGVDAKDAQRIDTPELAEQAERLSQRAEELMTSVGSHGVPTILKVVGDTLELIDHTLFYGRPNDIAAFVEQSQAALV